MSKINGLAMVIETWFFEVMNFEGSRFIAFIAQAAIAAPAAASAAAAAAA